MVVGVCVCGGACVRVCMHVFQCMRSCVYDVCFGECLFLDGGCE